MHVITQSCVLFLWLHLLTFVQSQDCTLQQFLNSGLYDSNFDTSDLETSYPSGKQVRISCIVGYTGVYKLTCTDGTWTYRGSRCQPRSCGHPGNASFADFQLDIGDDFVFGSQVVYTCHKGYQMISQNNVRRCMSGGWDGVVPVCEAVECPMIRVPNNIQVTGELEQANFGTVLQFSCKSRNEVLNGPAEIYCDENGEWNGQPPTCDGIKCFAPVINHGEVRGDITEYQENSILNFVCDIGYRKSDDRSSTCVKQGMRAQWDPTPECEWVKCKLPPAIGGSTYDPPFKGLFLPGETVTITCGERYWVGQKEASVVSTCLITGKWDIEPLCQEVTCTRYDPLVEHWGWARNNKIKLHDTVGYTCRSGYKQPRGVDQATCTRQGWSPNPLCEPPLDCGTPPHVTDGDVKDTVNSTYTHGQRVEYMCQIVYTMEGGPYKTCHDSEWIGDIRCIKPCTVTRDQMQKHNIQFRYRNDDKLYVPHGDRIPFSCITGTTHDGVLDMTQYCNEGVMPFPTCLS